MDFSVLMLVLLIVCGAIWGLDSLLAAPGRRQKAVDLGQADDDEAVKLVLKEPVIVEYARVFFPVILLVFVLRAFIVEPFRIPSGSMMPSLLAGDFILVNKFSYGLRFPGFNIKMINIDKPARGDVIVFRFPEDPSVNYIKRTIGLPGDHIVYKHKRLYINDKLIPQVKIKSVVLQESGARLTEMQRWKEDLDGARHDILKDGDTDSISLEFRVPEGHYFVMGDNRDRSNDSRYWGYVPEDHLIGKAFFIWFNWTQDNSKWSGKRIMWDRIGNTIQ